jgi:hypothetical protein
LPGCAAREGRAGEAEIHARRAIVLSLVAALKPLVPEIGKLTRQITTAVRGHADGEIFLSLFKDPNSVVTGPAREHQEGLHRDDARSEAQACALRTQTLHDAAISARGIA